MDDQTAQSQQTAQAQIKWYRSPVPPEVLRSLSRPDNTRGALQAGGHLGLACLTGAMAYWCSLHFAWYVLLLALFIHGTVMTMMFAAVHELSHERVFSNSKANRAMLGLFSFLTWYDYPLYQLSHRAHHRFTLHPPADEEVLLPQKITLANFLANTLVDPREFFHKLRYFSRMALGKPTGSWEKRVFESAGAKAQRSVINWARLLLLGHGLIVLVSLYFGEWMIPVLVSLATFYGRGWLMTLVGMPQHMGLRDNVDDFRLCCRTITLNPLLTFLYWRMNYHTEHHMYPAVPCYNLPKLHALIKHDLPHTHHGLLATWLEIAYTMSRQQYEPAFQFEPTLPRK
ncbi:MAG: fatty acid desaturase [Haliea sp.]|uniref:fatty acid desaturase n=1 Tax=Haliea sp. TaxID=1932666 RepID=UPI0032EE9C3B